jgi:ribonuclease E
MSKRMLIDGAHPEEIRVVVTSGNRLDEYDIETTFKKQVKGNIYLAKVTRVEPSLQAAFVDFGGNRHGFLAFSEIHPDYYQIPTEDRQALLDEQEELERKARAAREHLEDLDGDLEDLDGDAEDSDAEDVQQEDDDRKDADTEEEEASAAEESKGEDESDHAAATAEMGNDEDAPEDGDYAAENNEVEAEADTDSEDANGDKDPGPVASDPEVEEALEAAESAAPRRTRSMRRYKIQEVIKRRQILLVQVVKEERGNKGAALTTYISLAGRYCVLMPNSSRGGGISRKITGSKERRKLRDTLNSLDIPQGMGVIIRTAGLERNKAEIKRDFEFLIRAWDEVRETTLQSTAPDMVYEEGDIIKRAIRDVYSKDIDEIQVEGLETYQTAKRFMRLMMPSHAKRVQQYRDETIPLYQRFQIEQQLYAMHNPEVQLKSGGYIVINPTEALVAIDVNSGKSTRERNIEETALKTNLEAAEEVARQLRLRDLAGLIVIDFIDMEDGRNVRKVERRLKDAMKTDRARLQIGRISNFGLLELSRQRLRPSLLETSSQICPHCRGTGNVLSTESMAMRVLRTIEEEGIRMRTSEITVRVPTEVALYILNQKRSTLVSLEERYGFQVILEGDDSVIPPDIDIDRVKGKPEPTAGTQAAKTANTSEIAEDVDVKKEESSDQEGKPRRGRRRRGRRRDQNAEKPSEAEENVTVSEANDGKETEGEVTTDSEEGAEKPARRRRRGRRGGRRRNQAVSENEAEGQTEKISEPSKDLTEDAEVRKASNANAEENQQEAIPGETNGNASTAEPDNPAKNSESETNGQDTNEEGGAEELSRVSPDPEDVSPANVATDGPKRQGWWQRIVD